MADYFCLAVFPIYIADAGFKIIFITFITLCVFIAQGFFNIIARILFKLSTYIVCI